MAKAEDTRIALEEAIERAIEALNALDGDTDAEPEEDCCPAGEDDFQKFAASDACPGAMEDDELSGDEQEPSLGSLSCVGSCHALASGSIGFSQAHWSAGDRRELEDEHDGSELSLGWPEFPRTEMQTHPMAGEAVDCEQ